jgi:hypothetical protein
MTYLRVARLAVLPAVRRFTAARRFAVFRAGFFAFARLCAASLRRFAACAALFRLLRSARVRVLMAGEAFRR